VKTFAERNQVLIGAVGVTITAAAVMGALQYQKLPFINPGRQYSAFFAEAGGLSTGSPVAVSGYEVGQVNSVRLDGQRVAVTFTVAKNIHIGERSEAAIKTKSVLGAMALEVQPRGDGELTQPIPLERTTPPYQLADALGDLATTIDGTDTEQLSRSLDTLADTFSSTPPELHAAIQGLSRFSESLGKRDDKLRHLLANANAATKILAQRSDQIVSLVRDGNALLGELRAESAALEQVSGTLSHAAIQLSGFVNDNRQQLRPALDKLNGVLTILSNRRQGIQKSLHLANSFVMSLGESVASGPFFNAYVANLLPGQFIQPFVDAAFSDLGLDPNVLAPSELTDPQTGQPGTPPLPVPYPRTGQGGEPRLNLPDAITGKPGDPRYPYREPPPAPAPGGPPPGPPVPTPPDPGGSQPNSTPTPTIVLAPGEVSSSGGHH